MSRVVEYKGSRCPKCHCTLITNGTDVWCSFIGGKTEAACAFGILHPVTVNDMLELERHQVEVLQGGYGT